MRNTGVTTGVLYECNPIIGTVMSRSALLTVLQTCNFVGSLLDLTGVLAIPGLCVRLTIEVETVGAFVTVGQTEFVTGDERPQTVTWSGFARRVRLTLETSRIVSLGMQITY